MVQLQTVLEEAEITPPSGSWHWVKSQKDSNHNTKNGDNKEENDDDDNNLNDTNFMHLEGNLGALKKYKKDNNKYGGYKQEMKNKKQIKHHKEILVEIKSNEAALPNKLLTLNRLSATDNDDILESFEAIKNLHGAHLRIDKNDVNESILASLVKCIYI